MTTLSYNKIVTDPDEIRETLRLADEDQWDYILPRTAELCLAKYVELLFRKNDHPIRLLPFQSVMLHMLWHKKFPMVLACRGAGKTWMIAVYCLLKALLVPGTKIVVVSGGFRQAKFVFQYIDQLIKDSPIIQETIRKFHPGNEFGVKFATDRVYLKVSHNSEITGIPIGDGSKVRGLRATTLICDEVASIDDKVFDTAIGPFLSVKADPSEAVIVNEFIERLVRLGADPKVVALVEAAQNKKGNQLVLTGTATYQFNHFYRRYRAYETFANSGGDKKLLKEGLQLQAGETGAVISDKMLDLWSEMYSEYSIFQLPYYGMPNGFLDELIVASHKATMNPVIFGHEYECTFSKDTNGFFPRSIVDEASPGKGSPDEVHYELYGDPHAQYVMGLDPARHNDNFGLVVLKIENGTAKTVYCESWNKLKFQDSVKRIREILRRFPNIVHIAMDRGGGGDTVQELLANAKMLKDDEKPIIEFEPSDEYKGIPNALRILEMINFHSWTVPANHALRSDITVGKLLFPNRIDDDVIMHKQAMTVLGRPLDLDNSEDARFYEHINDLLYGTEDDNGDTVTHGAYKEVQLMIDELCTIVQTVSDRGTESFSLPRLADQSEGLDVRRRDRYSALLLAAHAARQVIGHGHQKGYQTYGGSTGMILGSRPSSGRKNYLPIQRRGGVAY